MENTIASDEGEKECKKEKQKVREKKKRRKEEGMEKRWEEKQNKIISKIKYFSPHISRDSCYSENPFFPNHKTLP